MLCFTQYSNERAIGRACTRQFSLDPGCAPVVPDAGVPPRPPLPDGGMEDESEAYSCQGVAAFGDIVQNGNLCTGAGPPHVPVHVRGGFGESPALLIVGPNGYQHSTVMNHSGQSCNYQYNWDPTGSGGTGTYSFRVTGAGKVFEFTASLYCP